ncbi:MAG TPA: hypothetical protein VGA89_00310 [Patescibacteria group bacterium]|jgi:hypothetical protein
MKKLLIRLAGLLIIFLQIGSPVRAQTDVDDTTTSTTIFGTIQAPAGVDRYNLADESGIGLITFISNLIRVATVVAGVWVMINFILAGWKYIIGSGDSKAPSEASQMMTNSLIGLAIIVGAYTLAAVIGLIFFGDATFIISPQLRGV